MASVQVRYIVHDVDAAIAFYTRHFLTSTPSTRIPHRRLPCCLGARPATRSERPESAGGGAGQPMPDGTAPQPGGWESFPCAFRLISPGRPAVARLRLAGAHFRNDIVTGVGGKQILVDDPLGNPVELFEPTRPEARLTRPGLVRLGFEAGQPRQSG